MTGMIIAYENSLMHLCRASLRGAVAVPDGFHEMDGDALSRCFEALVAGVNVFVWVEEDARRLFHYLHGHYRFVKAAGGVVSSPEGDCLMIARDGRWDLPKGMVEPGETLRQAARREVMEETGVEPTAVGRLIAKTYHIYDKYGGWHLKQTSWFAMTAPRQETRPQNEEGIAQAVWVEREVCRARLKESYASLRELRIED